MSARQNRHRQHGNPFTVRGPIDVPDWSTHFGRDAPLAMDVGFGAGEFLLELGRQHPEWNVLGIEIRGHWVEGALANVREKGLKNVHAMVANANSHFAELVPVESITFVSVNFPDPWFKNCHKKRRVINGPWLDVLATKMRPNAELHIMTDFQPVAEEALLLLSGHARFEAVDGDRFLPESTTEIQSDRERCHIRRGERIYRLMYRLHRT